MDVDWECIGIYWILCIAVLCIVCCGICIILYIYHIYRKSSSKYDVANPIPISHTKLEQPRHSLSPEKTGECNEACVSSEEALKLKEFAKEKRLDEIIAAKDEEISNLKEESEARRVSVDGCRNNITAANETIEKLEWEKHDLQRSLEQFRNTISANEDEIKRLKEEKNGLQNRLATEMSQKLSADESSFENISIKARPMNIAEDYGMLFSNTWLDAKIALDTFVGEHKNWLDVCSQEWRTTFLCNIVLMSYSVASQKFEGIRTNFSRWLSNPDDSPSVVNTQEKTKLVENALVYIGDFYRKTSANLPSGNMIKESNIAIQKIHAPKEEQFTHGDLEVDVTQRKLPSVKPITSECLELEKVNIYLTKCVHICWQMVLQRPPMTLDISQIGCEHVEDKNLQLMWGSNPNNEHAKVRYYKCPTLFHGGRCMSKGEVFVE